MRQYKIIKSILWYNIYKKREKDGLISLWFLWPQGKWILDKTYAKTFYNEEDAIAALVICKYNDGKDAG